MSLPSYAIFYKGGKVVHKELVNIGWFYDDKLVPGLLRELKEKLSDDLWNNWDFIKLYHKTHTRNEVELMLRPIPLYKRLWRRIRKLFRKKAKFDFTHVVEFPLIRRISPSLIAEDLVAVQPLSLPLFLKEKGGEYLMEKTTRSQVLVRNGANFHLRTVYRADDGTDWVHLNGESRQISKESMGLLAVDGKVYEVWSLVKRR